MVDIQARHRAPKPALQELRGEEEIVSDGSPFDEARLQVGDKASDDSLQAGGEDLRCQLRRVVLEADGAASISGGDINLLGEKDHMRLVDAPEISSALVEGIDEGHHGPAHDRPEFAVEGRPKAVWAGATRRAHLPECLLYLR
jgi:hypothetical protein